MSLCNKILSTGAAALSIIVSASLASCGGGRAHTSASGGREVPMEYAENLTIREHEGFTEVDVRNPWDTVRTLQKYLLVPSGAEMPARLPEGTVVRTPVTNALVYSTVHNGLIAELGCVESIGGVCNAKYINEGPVRSRLEKGLIADCGVSLSPDMEKILKLRPQVIMLSPFENNDKYAKVGEIGIPIIECADYMETSALGRAEWVKFYGRLFGRTATADSLWRDTERLYTALRDKARAADSRAKVIIDQRYGQVWNVPGGESVLAGLIRDAGGTNPFDSYSRSGSVPLAPEKVLGEAYDADIWFVRYNQQNDKTLRELGADAPVNSRFKAYREGRVYGCNTRYVNFYEETPFHPDRLLEDMIRCIHPGLLPDTAAMRYYTPMK